jgi:hypothetical protein
MRTHVNLVPLAIQKQTLLHRLIRVWVRLAVFSLFSGIGMYLWLSEQHAVACRKLEQLSDQVHPLTQLDHKNQLIAQTTKQLEKELQAISALEQAHVPLSVMGVIGQCFNAVERPIRLDSLRMELSNPTLGDATKKTTVGPAVRIMLLGSAFDDVAISSVMQQLQARNLFSAVELEASQATSVSSEGRRSFQIRCQF